MKISSFQYTRKILVISLFFLLAFSGMGIATTYAQSSSTLAQSFKADNSQGEIVPGALVSVTSNDERRVQLATLSSANRLVGVVDKNPLVSISQQGNQDAEVVLNGSTNVLVSDINGQVKTGDKVTVSPIAGVGMRANVDGQVVGTAQTDFKPSGTRSVKDRDGKSHTVQLGYVSVQIGIASYQAPGSNFLPPFIQNAANSIAGRPVSLIRVLICSLLLILGFTSVIILVYTSVRSAMTSIGRNPLAAKAIRRGMVQIAIVSLIVVGGTLLASYLILTV